MISHDSPAQDRLPLRFVHVGDLHITTRSEQNYVDFLKIIGEINTHIAGHVDFVVLPGDNADDGTAEQFELVRHGLDGLHAPWHALPGDHDFKARTLTAYYRVLKVRALPYAEIVQGCRCLFLDSVSSGGGGPDFRLGNAQIEWLRAELVSARQASQVVAVFMHTYPSDLQEAGDEVAALLRDNAVAFVDTGHTHYNELAVDGRTVYAAVRSTGQVEEGDVGFAVCAIDKGSVSWRFKTLTAPWPFVLITSPADRRLAVDPLPSAEAQDAIDVRASVWGRDITGVACRIDDGVWQPMQFLASGVYCATAKTRQETFELSVRATDRHGGSDVDTITVSRSVANLNSDFRALDAWKERHLLGTRLGPNANGRKW